MANNFDNEILQISKHSLDLEHIKILDNESQSTNSVNEVKPSKIIGMIYPYVEINSYEIPYSSLMNIEFRNSGFLSSIYIKFLDFDNFFKSRYFPLDGQIINFYIRSNNEKLYKPIHINFEILSITSSGYIEGKQIFIVQGQMKIPNLYTEYSESFNNLSSLETLIEISDLLNIGFSTNEQSTNDVMTWINPYSTRYEFIKEITRHSYKNQNSFFTSYIDPYYNLSFINLDKCLSNQNILNSEIYSNLIQDINDENIQFDKTPLLLSNNRNYTNNTKYITSYKLFNNTASIFLSNGYNRAIQYYDEIGNEYINHKNHDLIIKPNNGYLNDKIHFRGRKINNELEKINNKNLIDQYIKYKYLGKQNENVHDYYLLSDTLNYQNLVELNKISMTVELSGIDLSIYRFQTIPILIYEYDLNTIETMKKVSEKPIENEVSGILNEFLSGMYVISDIFYVFKLPGQMFQRINLIKRESGLPF